MKFDIYICLIVNLNFNRLFNQFERYRITYFMINGYVKLQKNN